MVKGSGKDHRHDQQSCVPVQRTFRGAHCMLVNSAAKCNKDPDCMVVNDPGYCGLQASVVNQLQPDQIVAPMVYCSSLQTRQSCSKAPYCEFKSPAS